MTQHQETSLSIQVGDRIWDSRTRKWGKVTQIVFPEMEPDTTFYDVGTLRYKAKTDQIMRSLNGELCVKP